MSFEKVTSIEFVFEGEKIPWTIQRMIGKEPITTESLNWQICCQHPVFVGVFSSPSMFAPSLDSVIRKGKSMNYNFFHEMLMSFRYHSSRR
jgi:hypothetical protein